MNSVVVVGRAGQDAQMKSYESGKSVTTFSLAVNRWNAKTKEQVTDWFNVQIWDKRAEVAAEYVKKGTMLSVEGKIIVSKWQTPDGEEVERYLINATNFGFVSSKKDTQA